ncbi:32705_t:CDS:2 [Gigaspora margarita]|uniref:32705_t:CDS:1 n=1 Tax=Gigaspora margarita TaxID=4874 RepID=A0ABN7VXL7_GIGMA|nr:32705_t:CDS:2 [Gigaspora margarita]
METFKITFFTILKYEKRINEIKEKSEKNSLLIGKAAQTISELQEKFYKKDQEINYYSLFFGKSFEIAQELYEQKKLTRQVYTIVNDFSDETFHFENDNLPDSQIFQFKEFENGYEAFEEFI